MPPKPPTKSKYEQSLEKTVAGQTALRVNTNAVDRGSSSKYSVVIYSEGRYAGKARLLEWTPDGSRIATGRTISIEEANRLGGRGPAPRGNIDELRRQVNELKAVAPNASGRYQYANQTFTKAGWDAYVKPFEDRLAQLEAESGIRSEQARQQGRVGVDTEIARVNKVREQLTRLVTDFKDEADAATEIPAQDNYRRWADYYQAKLDELGRYVTGLDAGSARIGDVSTDFQQTDFARAATVPPTTGEAQPRVSGPGQYGVMPTGSVGQVLQTGPLPAGQREQVTSTGTSRMPTLDEINRQRTAQGLPALVVRGGQVVDPTTGQNVPNVSPTPTGTTPTGTTTVPGGGTGGQAVGGTTTGAVPPAGAAPGAPAAPAVPPAWEQAAREQFGAYYEVIKNLPEVMKIIERDMTVGLSDTQFQAELEKTTWWRTTTASARAWEEDKARDPATVQTRIDNQLAALRDSSLRLGLRLRDDVLAKLAEDSLKFGWSATVIDNTLGAEALKSTGGVSDLRRGYIGQTIRATAGAYGVPLSDVTFNEWVGKIAVGQESEASFQAYALDLAKNLYPSLAPSLDKGVSFRAITDPYRQSASRILEINPETIDFADPKWAQAFTSRNDKGEQSMMTYGEWNDYLRTNPTFGYEYTDGAKERAFTVVNRLAELFGAA